MRKEVTRQVEEKGFIEDALCCHICSNKKSLDNDLNYCSYWSCHIEPYNRCGKFGILIIGKKERDNASN